MNNPTAQKQETDHGCSFAVKENHLQCLYSFSFKELTMYIFTRDIVSVQKNCQFKTKLINRSLLLDQDMFTLDNETRDKREQSCHTLQEHQ